MTSPRLSTVGTISAIERALEVLERFRTKLPQVFKPSERDVVAAARAELAELRAQPEPLKPEQEQALQALADDAQAMGLYDKPEQGRDIAAYAKQHDGKLVKVTMTVEDLPDGT